MRCERTRIGKHLIRFWLLACVPSLPGCTKDLHLIEDPPNAAAATTTGPWASMIYVARTDSGVIAIDLGWTGSERVLPQLLANVNATPADVRFAFLTHAHRDHIAAWPLVRQARFVLGGAEVPAFLGEAGYSGWAAKVGDELNAYPHPKAGELALEDYARTVAGAGAAEVIRDAGEGSVVRGVHLCAGAPATAAVRDDVEGFARSLAADRPHGLGWS